MTEQITSWTILVVEDDRSMRKGLVFALQDRGYRIFEAESLEAGIGLVRTTPIDLLITDLRLETTEEGNDLVRELKTVAPLTPAIVITAYGSIDAAVRAMKSGADDFVEKGFTIDAFLVKIEKLLEKRSLLLEKESLGLENSALKRRLENLDSQWHLIGDSPSLNEVRNQILSSAGTDLTVLIEGETGAGKELVARAIHAASNRKYGPFTVIDCCAIPLELLESELFGHEKGAFTGAFALKPGQIELADRGVLFLDEIGEIKPELQPKLLRFLETRQFYRVGGIKLVGINTRIIAATNRNLFEEVAAGRFREDLYYRLNALSVKVPPLREHRQDIPQLVTYFIEQACRETKADRIVVRPETIEMLCCAPWPGNVRQLRNLVFRACCLSDPGQLIPAIPQVVGKPGQINSTPGDTGIPSEASNYKDAAEQLEESFLRSSLREANGQIRTAARLMGVSRNTLKRLLIKYGLSNSSRE